MNNPALYQLFREYIQYIHECLAEQMPSFSFTPQKKVYVKEPERLLRTKSWHWKKKEVIDYRWSVMAIYDKLPHKEDYEQKIAVQLEEDPVISSQLNKMVGGFTTRFPIDSKVIVTLFWSEYFESVQRNDFDELIFNRIYERIEHALYSKKITFEIIVPLYRLYIPQELPIQISNNIQLDRITEDEASKFIIDDYLIDERLIDTQFSGIILRYKLTVQKKVEEQGEQGNTTSSNKTYNYDQKIDEAIKILKTYQNGNFITGHRIFINKDGLNSGVLQTEGDDYYSHRYFLEDQGLANYIQNSLSKAVKEKHFIEVARNRLAYAKERDNIEDKIVDLHIAAEALFQTSNNYRLAMRASWFNIISNCRQKDIFDLYQEISKFRNAIVHGEIAKLQHDRTERVQLFEEHLQSSLHKVINYYSSGNEVNIDFEKNIFGA